MNPKEEESSINTTSFIKVGSVFPRKREHISTMMGKEITDAGKKAVESAVDAVKKSGEMNPNEEERSINATSFIMIGSVFPKKREHLSTMAGKKIADAGKKAVEFAVDAVKKRKDQGKISDGY